MLLITEIGPGLQLSVIQHLLKIKIQVGVGHELERPVK